MECLHRVSLRGGPRSEMGLQSRRECECMREGAVVKSGMGWSEVAGMRAKGDKLFDSGLHILFYWVKRVSLYTCTRHLSISNMARGSQTRSYYARAVSSTRRCVGHWFWVIQAWGFDPKRGKSWLFEEGVDPMAARWETGSRRWQNGEGKWHAVGNGDTATLPCVVRARAHCPVALGMSELVGNAHSKATACVCLTLLGMSHKQITRWWERIGKQFGAWESEKGEEKVSPECNNNCTNSNTSFSNTMGRNG